MPRVENAKQAGAYITVQNAISVPLRELFGNNWGQLSAGYYLYGFGRELLTFPFSRYIHAQKEV